jgi:thiol:disulfide interchange protein DsbG
VQKFAAFLLCLMSLSAGVCVAGSWVPPPGGSPIGLMQRLDRAKWIGSGPKSAARTVYVFTDPNCPFCNDLWKALKTARAPDVQIRYLLVAVISPDSRGKDAAILESPDPAAALEAGERNFDKGGVAPKSTVQPATAEAVSANEALMGALHIYGTPGLVYLDASGAVKVFAGMPDSKQLRDIVGTGGQRSGAPVTHTTQRDLIGAWRLADIEVKGPSGRELDPFYGNGSHGLMIYDASGWFSVQIENAERPVVEVPSMRPVAQESAAQNKAKALDSYYAYFGTWSFDEASSTVTHHAKGALYPSEDAAIYKQHVEVVGSNMIFSREQTIGGRTTVQTKRWERVTAER